MERFSEKDDALQQGACVSLSGTENQQVVSALKNRAIGMNAPMNSPYYFVGCIPISQSIKCHCIHPQYSKCNFLCCCLVLLEKNGMPRN